MQVYIVTAWTGPHLFIFWIFIFILVHLNYCLQSGPVCVEVIIIEIGQERVQVKVAFSRTEHIAEKR